MHYIFKIGPVQSAEGGWFSTYVSLGDGITDLATEPDDGRGLAELVRRGTAQGATCEPELADAARKHGLQSGPLPAVAAKLKLAIAIGLAHGSILTEVKDVELLMELIDAVERFERAHPWDYFLIDEPLDLTVKGALNHMFEATVLGGGGEEYGLVLYDERGSLAAIEAAAEAGEPERAALLDALALTLDDEPAFLAEAMKVACGVGRAPYLLRLKGGEEQPLDDSEMACLIASLRAVTSLATGAPEGRGKSAAGRRKAKARATRRPGARSEAKARSKPPRRGPGASWHDRNDRLLRMLTDFARARFGADRITQASQELFGPRPPHPELLIPWALYEWPIDGKPIAAHYVERPDAVIDAADRQWLLAQLRSRCSIWEVLRVERGTGLELVNLLTGQRGFVHELLGSSTLGARDALLTRVVDIGELHLFAGLHPQPLPPSWAAKVVQRFEGTDAQKPSAPELMAAWAEALDAMHAEAASPARRIHTALRSDLHLSWLDVAVPALGGRTPRSAMRDAAGRAQLHLLLKELENHDAYAPKKAEVDVAALRRELGLTDLGELDPNHDIDAALGAGRKISETLLDFAAPLLDAANPETVEDMEAMLSFAAMVWNVAVADQTLDLPGKLAELRKELGPFGDDAQLLDSMLQRKREHFAGDRRLIGKVSVERLGDGINVKAEARLPEQVAEEARRRGIDPES